MTAQCRFCKAPLTLELVDLGATPLANSYLPPTAEAMAAEGAWPLRAMVCTGCWLVQLDHDAPAEAIFDHDYAYLSSYSAGWVAHAGRYATAMIDRFGLTPADLVAEIASNDGYLLQHFVTRGFRVLGVEPAGHAAGIAQARGVTSEVCFFGADTAPGLAERHGRARLIAANNVLAHVPDIRGFVAGFPHLLAEDGVATFEFPHLLNLLRRVQFDTIYHEHYSYLSLLAVETVLASAGLRVFDVEELPTHGGSLRVLACHADGPHAEGPGLAQVRTAEAAAGLGSEAAYRDFAPRVARLRDGFLGWLQAQVAGGRRVGAYGAAAKGNTFLNFCGIGPERIGFVADRNPQKQGRLLPGSHIPVISPEAALARRPDVLVILPWNLRAEISAEMAAIRDWGGCFAVVDPDSPDQVESF